MKTPMNDRHHFRGSELFSDRRSDVVSSAAQAACRAAGIRGVRFFTVACLFALASLVGCEGRTEVFGKVQSASGQPLRDAIIEVFDQGFPVLSVPDKSDKNGFFRVIFEHAPSRSPEFVLQVSKEGFRSKQLTFVGGKTTHIAKPIVLKRE